MIISGLVLGVLGFIFQSLVLDALGALAVLGGAWLRAPTRTTHRS